MAFKIRTSQFVKCSTCGHTKDFGEVTAQQAVKEARRVGWRGHSGDQCDPFCPKCIARDRSNGSTNKKRLPPLANLYE